MRLRWRFVKWLGVCKHDDTRRRRGVGYVWEHCNNCDCIRIVGVLEARPL